MNVESFIKKIKESSEYKLFEQEMGASYSNVGNVTSNIDGYQTPNAFSKSEEDFEKNTKDRIEVFGYKSVGKTKPKHTQKMNTNESQILPPSMYKQAMETLTEASYKDYRFDESRTSIRKINDSIKQLNSKIYEVERVIDHALKLKTEMAIDQRKLWRSSLSKLTKVSERVTRISKKIHELGA